MRLPGARGPLSEYVIDSLLGRALPHAAKVSVPRDDPLVGDDLHLALYLCYELHYATIESVDPRMEWDPALLAFRAELETAFEEGLRSLAWDVNVAPGEVIDRIMALIDDDPGPSLSRFIEEEATLTQVREFMIHRSAYQLKEADPHSWVIPRLRGPAKAALVEIQSDEYGGGRGERIHSHLFGKSLAALGLDATYGAYVDLVPGYTLATVNLVSMFGLHRRLRGAVVGHLATFESTSSEPNGRYARGLRRLGFDGDATDFFDEHVEADAVHEVIAIHDLVGGLIAEEPELSADVVWGAASLLRMEEIWARRLMEAWITDSPSLRETAEVS